MKKETQYPSAKGTSVVYKLSFSQKSFYLKNVDYEFGLLVDGAPSQSKYVALAPESQQVNKFGRMNWYGSMSGTSMSTPHVAGIITLWMQAKPTLTVNEILLALKQTCDNDSWTTDVSKIPSGHIEQAGLGKINALNGLKHLLGMPTGILEIDRQADTQKAAWFTLDGRRISATPTAKGIYIHQGRKVVVK